jgi:hypothetical protein
MNLQDSIWGDDIGRGQVIPTMKEKFTDRGARLVAGDTGDRSAVDCGGVA